MRRRRSFAQVAPHGGFTLVELMTVTAVILILSTLAGIRFERQLAVSKGMKCSVALREIHAARVAKAANAGALTVELTAADLEGFSTVVRSVDNSAFKCPYDGETAYTIPADIERPPTCANYMEARPQLHVALEQKNEHETVE